MLSFNQIAVFFGSIPIKAEDASKGFCSRHLGVRFLVHTEGGA
jgi:hypothetical protein